jgi:transforming growth factor-beta-induced protein
MKKLLIAGTIAVTGLLIGAPTASADETKPTAEVASSNPDFSTLVAALGAADLVGPFDSCDDAKTTVFAPTNAAFDAALKALGMTAEELLADKELLTTVLTYHVVSGAVDAATVVGLDKATTLEGSDIMIEVVNGGVVLNDSVKVVTTDIKTCNGIIHVIDAVLLPPAEPTAGAMPNTGAGSLSITMLASAAVITGLAMMFAIRRRTVTA